MSGHTPWSQIKTNRKYKEYEQLRDALEESWKDDSLSVAHNLHCRVALDEFVAALLTDTQRAPHNRARVVVVEDCDHCGAAIGEPCRKPSGDLTDGPHIVFRAIAPLPEPVPEWIERMNQAFGAPDDGDRDECAMQLRHIARNYRHLLPTDVVEDMDRALRAWEAWYLRRGEQ